MRRGAESRLRPHGAATPAIRLDSPPPQLARQRPRWSPARGQRRETQPTAKTRPRKGKESQVGFCRRSRQGKWPQRSRETASSPCRACSTRAFKRAAREAQTNPYEGALQWGRARPRKAAPARPVQEVTLCSVTRRSSAGENSSPGAIARSRRTRGRGEHRRSLEQRL